MGAPELVDRPVQPVLPSLIKTTIHIERKDLVALIDQGLAGIPEGRYLGREQLWLAENEARFSEPNPNKEDVGPGFLTPEEKAWIKAHPKISVVVMDAWPPLNGKNTSGLPEGIGVDYLKLLGSAVGLEFAITAAPFAANLEAVKTKKIDALMDVTPNPERKEYLNFTRPYLNVPHVMVARSDGPFYPNENYLKGKTIALERGFGNVRYFRQNYPQIKVVEYDNTLACLLAVSKGEADAYAGNRAVAAFLIAQELLTNLQIQGNLHKEGSILAIGVRKDWPELAVILDKALATLTHQDRQVILMRWTGEKAMQVQVALSPEEAAWVRAHPKIRLAGLTDFPPFHYVDENGAYVGIVTDILKIVAERIGFEIEPTVVTFPEGLTAVREKRLDLVPEVVDTPERREYLGFTKPYLVVPRVLVVNKGSTVSSGKDLTGKRLVLEKGNPAGEMVRKNWPQVEIQEMNTTLEALTAVSTGQADAYLGNSTHVAYLVDRHKLQWLVRLPFTDIGPIQLSMGVRQDWDKLVRILEKGLDSLTPAQRRQIHQMYVPPHFESEGQLVLTDKEKAWLQGHQDLKVGVTPDWPPFEFVDPAGRFSGISSEYVAWLNKTLGLNMLPRTDLTWAQILDAAHRKEIDIIPAIVRSPEREEYLRFTRPYIRAPLVLITRDDAVYLDGLDKLAGQTVAVIEGFATQRFIERDHPDIKLFKVKTSEAALMAVAEGLAVATVENAGVLHYLSTKLGLVNLKVAAPTPYSFDLAFGVRKDMPELADILDKALASISPKDQAVFQERWVNLRVERKTDWGMVISIVLAVIVVAAVILTVIIRANRRLALEVKERTMAEQKMQAMSEAIHDGLVVIDAQARVKYWNQAAEAIFGMSANEAMGKDMHALFAPEEYRERAKTGLEIFARTGLGPMIGTLHELMALRADGSRIPVEVGVSAFQVGDEWHAVGTIRDITPRKKAEETLMKLSRAVDQSPVSVVITDKNGTIEYVNPAFTRVTGYTLEEAVGQNPRILKAGNLPASHYQGLWTTIKAGREWVGELVNRKKNGEELIEWAAIAPIVNDMGEITHFVAVKEDITKNKQMEKEIIEAKERAEEATRAKSDFLANMSHEIRTPMNAIIGMTHLALKTELTPKQHDYLYKIEISAKSLLGIINDILDFSKIEAGKLAMEAIEFDLSETLDHVANLITVKAQEKGNLEVLFRLDPTAPTHLVGDPLRLGQVLINLGNNAVKFTRSGEIVLNTKVIQQTDQQVTMCFSVRDTGLGMTPEQKSRLFQAFSQADTSTTRKFGGTGLGLTISKRLVEMMKGEIWVESEPGVGSEFIFTATFGLTTGGKKESIFAPAEMAGLRILVVDDNRTARQIFVEMVNLFGFESDSAASGAEAVRMVTKSGDGRPYDLLLMDWKMPDMDGIETSRCIRELTKVAKQPKIVLVTAYAQDEAMAVVKQANLDGLIIKPVSASILFNTILQAFGKSVAQSRFADLHDRDGESFQTIAGTEVLLVEDNEINQQVAQEILEGAGMKVTIAVDGLQAIEALEDKEFDVVLMDVQMPVMDGYQATEAIRKKERYQNLPIVAMTASAMVQDREKAMSVGMNDHVSKPIEPRQLFSTLARWVKPRIGLRGEAPPGAERKASEVDIELPNLPGLDVANGLRRVGGNKRLYLKLLRKFRDDFSNADSRIKEILAMGDKDGAQRLAHTVKGVAGNIGALKLQSSAAEVEGWIKNNREGDIEEALIPFGVELGAVMKSLSPIADEPDRPPQLTASNIDTDKLIELLDQLQPHLKHRNPKLCQAVLDQAGRLAWPPNLVPELDDLRKLIRSYKFKEAQSVHESIMNILNRERNSDRRIQDR